MRFTLMNKDDAVLDFEYDEAQHAVLRVYSAHDLSRAPLAIWNDRIATFATWETLASLVSRWWKRRGIPDSRVGLKQTKRLAGFRDPMQLTAATCGFSLTDQYWARPYGSDLTWERGNYFLNDFDDGIGRILAGISNESDDPSPISPSATVDGNLQKMWHVGKGGIRELYKAGSGVLKQEPFNEVVATALYRRLFDVDDFVSYTYSRQGFGYYSVCPCSVDADHEFVTARDIYWAAPQSDASPTLRTLLEAARHHGAPGFKAQLNQVLTCDYILENIDRHLGNLGVLCSQQTKTFKRLAPIFDSGLSLLCYEGERDQDALAVTANPLLPRQSQQLALVDDFSWFDKENLDGFAAEAVGILQNCPSRYMDAERLDHLHAFIESGIRTVSKIADAAPVDTNDMDAIQQRANTIDAIRADALKVAGHPTVFRV